MTRVLAIIRRLFLGGLVSLIVGIFASVKSIETILNIAAKPDSFISCFCLFMMIAPILYIVSLFISCAFIRRHGQFAEVHKAKPFIIVLFKMIGSDLISPFKNIVGFFTALFNKYPDFMPDEMKRGSRVISIVRFIELIVLIAVCALGLIMLKQY